ncbi:hypothetical protein L4C54_17765 [Vibrio lamellibrachiae]|uniref:hypothetical protein n=1 Tax=Vibrio lamellibrachiae TaxID=2910253 RepID=UPI003D0A7FE5
MSHFFISIVSLFLAGCSSAPREITAQVPLLDDQKITQNFIVTDSSYWSMFANNAISQVQYQQQSVQLGATYTSALGLHCRSFHAINNQQDTVMSNRVVCREVQSLENTQSNEKSPWYMTNALVEAHAPKSNAQLNGAQ